MSDIVETRAPEAADLRPGMRVEVRRRFDDRWARGFEIAEICAEGFLLLRLSDHTVIPSPFCAADLRPERKKQSWWY